MDHPIVLHLPSKVFCALTDHAGEAFYGPKSEAVLSSLVMHWIATTKAAPRRWLGESEANDSEPAVPPSAPPDGATPEASQPPAISEIVASRGYQWKQVFLPNGTELRVIHGGRSTYATVQDEQIISDGLPITPSQLANVRGCGTRNAWRTIWLRFPGSTHWQRANECRR